MFAAMHNGAPTGESPVPLIVFHGDRDDVDLECFDRIHLNGWVHNLQVSGQVVSFLTRHLGFPILSPAMLEKIGLRFGKAVMEYARGGP